MSKLIDDWLLLCAFASCSIRTFVGHVKPSVYQHFNVLCSDLAVLIDKNVSSHAFVLMISN